jgi:hypothetical protein
MEENVEPTQPTVQITTTHQFITSVNGVPIEQGKADVKSSTTYLVHLDRPSPGLKR